MIHPSRTHDWSGLRFPRTRTDSQWVEMERSSPIRSYLTEILRLIGIGGIVLILALAAAVVGHG